MLQGVNVKINPDDIKSKNAAAVMVTAKLPAFARHGDKLDIEISSIGDAKSLQGGTQFIIGNDGNRCLQVPFLNTFCGLLKDF